MKKNEKYSIQPFSLSYSKALYFLFFLTICSFWQSFPGKIRFNDFMEKNFARAAFVFFSEERSNEFLSVVLPRKSVAENADDVLDSLKEIVKNPPRLLIIDSLPERSNFTQVFNYVRNSELKKRVVFCDLKENFIKQETMNIPHGYFIISQKKNFEVEAFVSKKGKPSVSCKALEILKNDFSINENCYRKTCFYFSDNSITRIFPSLGDKDDYNKCLDKIVLLKTGYSSELERPFLTMVGVMGSDTFLFNDIKSKLENNYFYLHEGVGRMIFIFSCFIIIVLFMKSSLLKGFLFSLLYYEILLITFWGLFVKSGLRTDWSMIFLFPALFLFLLMLLQLFKVSQIQDSLKEFSKLKDELVFKNKALASMRRLSELGRLSSTIYHEISHPLQNLTSSLNILNMEENLSEDGKGVLDIALSEVKRLARLSKGLRRFYQKSEKSSVIRMEINEHIRYCLKTMEMTLQAKDIALEASYTEDPAYIMADADRFKQIILNLLFNAIDAIGQSGFINVTVLKTDKSVEIHIKDSGPGINSEIRKEIFEAFFSTKGSMGTGLGLYVSYEIVEEIGGEIVISPFIEGEGAEFIIYLPVELLQ